MRMKVLLVDNHALFREGLRHILQQLCGDVGEILEAGSFPDGLKLAGQHPGLDLALLELKSPGSEGAVSVKHFHLRYPHIPLVVVSGEESDHTMSDALGYGARGFVHKSSSAAALLDALRRALSDSIYYVRSPGTANWNKNNPDGKRGPNANEHGLTARQMDILKYLAAGLSNKGIARATNLADGTVKLHVAAVCRALRANNRMEAVLVAERLGLTGTSCHAHASAAPAKRRTGRDIDMAGDCSSPP